LPLNSFRIAAFALAASSLFLSICASAEPERSSPLARAASAEETLATGLIVKFSATANVVPFAAQGRSMMIDGAIAQHPRVPSAMRYSRPIKSGAELHRFDRAVSVTDAEAMAKMVARMPGVEYAAPNRVITTQVAPSDPGFQNQWGFAYSPGVNEGANFVRAWDITRGNPNQTIGIIDAGVEKAHEAFVGRLAVHPSVPNGGYDFMSDPANAGDGDGRDNDPEQRESACGHGTHVAGTIAANTTFGPGGVGVAGGASESKIQAARALDFFGDDADAIDAMLWLGRLVTQDNVVNPFDVRVINMSFGGSGACGSAYEAALKALRQNGVLAVVAAGNSSTDVAQFAPANCPGVVAVAASTILGKRANFSNFGKGVTLAAPGLDILSVGGGFSGACSKSGTSMAAPHVTAAVGLMHAANASLTVSQTVLGLRAGARPFPPSSNCTTDTCGVGLLDAYGALASTSADAPTRVGWSAGAQSVRETDGNVTLTLTRIGNAYQVASATIAAVNGTASSGVDFGAPSPSTVSWEVGDVSDKTVQIPIIYRPLEQGARNFDVMIASVSGASSVVAPESVPVRITEVDCTVVTPITLGVVATGDMGVSPHATCRGGVRGPEFNTARYSFSGSAGQIVNIALNSTSQSSTLDTYLYLLDANLNIVAENDDIAAGNVRNSRILSFALPATGTYYIDATTWSSLEDNSGSYALLLSNCGSYIPTNVCNLDVDGNSEFDQTDATLILRRLFGVSDANIADGLSFNACATRTAPSAITSFIDSQRIAISASPTSPIPLDVDGDGLVNAATDGLVLLRVALGLNGAPVTNGAVNLAGIRETWLSMRPYLLNSCGLNVKR
jgi:serine protease